MRFGSGLSIDRIYIAVDEKTDRVLWCVISERATHSHKEKKSGTQERGMREVGAFML